MVCHKNPAFRGHNFLSAIDPCPACATPDLVGDPVSALRHVAQLPNIPPPGLRGNGIVMGFLNGSQTWSATVAQIKLMREINITTPIQYWCDYAGHELDDVPDVAIIDLPSFAKQHPWAFRRPKSFDIKAYIVAHCGFEKALWLDGNDAYLVRDPQPLFDLLDDVPFAYWSDFDRNMIQDWSPLQTPKRIPNQIQGGHILINCKAAWNVVATAYHYNKHWSYWYDRYPWHDESGWAVALAETGSDFRVVEPARWERFGFGCYIEGKQFIVHRVRCKLLGDAPRIAKGAAYENRLLQLYRDLIPRPAPESHADRIARIRREREIALGIYRPLQVVKEQHIKLNGLVWTT